VPSRASAVRELQLAQHRRHVALHRGSRDDQRVGDLRVRQVPADRLCCIEPSLVILTRDLPGTEAPAPRAGPLDGGSRAPAEPSGPSRKPVDRRSCGQDHRRSVNATVPFRDHRCRQPGGRAEELTQRRHEVPAGQPVQVEQRQHLADLRGLAAPGGRTAEENRRRSPVSGSTRRSLTRGAITSTAPALVRTSRGWWLPLRTTSRRPCPSRSAANRAM
jgi:hypothetical protein